MLISHRESVTLVLISIDRTGRLTWDVSRSRVKTRRSIVDGDLPTCLGERVPVNSVTGSLSLDPTVSGFRVQATSEYTDEQVLTYTLS